MSHRTVTSLDALPRNAAAHRKDEWCAPSSTPSTPATKTRIDEWSSQNFESSDLRGRAAGGPEALHADLRRSFSTFASTSTENVGVLVEGDLVAARTIITGHPRGATTPVSPRPGTPSRPPPRNLPRQRGPLVEQLGRSSTPTASWSLGAIPGWRPSSRSKILGVGHRLADVPRAAGTSSAEGRTTADTPRSPGPARAALRRRDRDGASERHMVAEAYIQNSGDPDSSRPSRAPFVDQPPARCPTAAPSRHNRGRDNRRRDRRRSGGTITASGPSRGFTTSTSSRIEDGRRRAWRASTGSGRLPILRTVPEEVTHH